MRRWRRCWPFVYAAGAAVALFGLGWLSLAFVELEGRARVQADRGEDLRLALWRMDSWLAAWLAGEAARGPEAYEAHGKASQASGEGPLQTTDVLTLSPLLELDSPYVQLHFQIDELGGWSSPQVPAGAVRGMAERQGLLRADEALLARKLAELERALSLAEAHARLALLDEELPSWLDGNVAKAEAQEAADQAGAPAADASGLQERRSKKELGLRAQNTYQSQLLANVKADDLALPSAPEVGPLVPLWIPAVTPGDPPRLAFVRRARIAERVLVQGLLASWPDLRTSLLDKVEDLFPAADLAPLSARAGAPEDGEQLASIPARLVSGPAATEAARGAGLGPAARSTLIVAWLAALFAVGAVGLTLRATVRYAETRSRFASTVTHELRTPLTTFRMYAEMLEKDMLRDDAQRREYLATLTRESDRLARLVENVLAYARLEEGRQAPRRERLRLRGLVERALPSLEGRALEAGALLEWEVAEGVGEIEVETDPDAVAQVLFNLVDNACKYGRDAAGQTCMELSVRAEPGYVVLSVADRGPGVPRGERRSVFEAFERGSRGAAEPNAGVGLGLALSMRVARALGGSLRVRPRPSGGAVFELFLPSRPLRS